MTSNFAFLRQYNAIFLQLAESAENYVFTDPNTSLVKQRQLSEAIARQVAIALNVFVGPNSTQVDLIDALEARGALKGDVARLFHTLRMAGNKAVHSFSGSPQAALQHLQLAFRLCCWFHKSVGGEEGKNFKAPAFVAPVDGAAAERARKAEEDRVRAELSQHRDHAAALQAKAQALDEERAVFKALAEEAEQRIVEMKAAFDVQLAAMKAEAEKTPPEVIEKKLEYAAAAASNVLLDEAETRTVIDTQLKAAGWEANSKQLRYTAGTRPQKGTDRAIAEWPTDSGPADYVLFRGLKPLAIVEAKRKAKSVSAAIEQSKRYSRDFKYTDGIEPPTPPMLADAPWDGWDAGIVDKKPRRYRVPFLYATNGREYLKQHEQESGIWFLDARLTTNHSRPLLGWHTPENLQELFEQDLQAADEKLKTEPTDYLGLREYQIKAIRAVEEAIAGGARRCLLAMATGTGKTKTIIGLLYRLLKTKRFRRILFLVDRTALGEQAQNAFKEMRLEQDLSFTDTYEVIELADIKPNKETKVHIATVQSMVKRIIHVGDDEAAVPIDSYDCIIVDESHRGYTLDKEMGEGELAVRSAQEYISSYRRVLDHFDAVKVGLTATPALHTKEIFGPPVYTYTYREAVVDGFLVDHEPPLRMVTLLAKEGIAYFKGETVPVLKSEGKVDLWQLEDDVKFEVDEFNKRVVTENFNRVVCQELTKYLEPTGEEKTLIFCATDAHADLVVKLLKECFDETHGAVPDDAIMKITGSIDKPDAAIRLLKNEKLPTIAVTVDLLTTGIDVPAICNLVFLRRVRSRILYAQMLGRATRLWPNHIKEVFRIYDAVDLYAGLEAVNDMKPVVQDVYIPTSQLVSELCGKVAHTAPGREQGRTHADDVLEQLLARLHRGIRRLEKAKATPEDLKNAVEALETLTAVSLKDVPKFFKEKGTQAAADFMRAHDHVGPLLDRVLGGAKEDAGVVLSDKPDKMVEVTHGYGDATKPADYLDAFGKFIKSHENDIAALTVVLQRPRDLTRQQLKELRLALDEAGYSEAKLRAAYRDAKMGDIAAGIIGYIRQRALGSPLEAYSVRVDRALKRIKGQQEWTPVQLKWLDRIGEQLKQETVVDKAAFDHAAFKDHGGFKTVDKVFGATLTQVLEDLGAALWDDAVA